MTTNLDRYEEELTHLSTQHGYSTDGFESYADIVEALRDERAAGCARCDTLLTDWEE